MPSSPPTRAPATTHQESCHTRSTATVVHRHWLGFALTDGHVHRPPRLALPHGGGGGCPPAQPLRPALVTVERLERGAPPPSVEFRLPGGQSLAPRLYGEGRGGRWLLARLLLAAGGRLASLPLPAVSPGEVRVVSRLASWTIRISANLGKVLLSEGKMGQGKFISKQSEVYIFVFIIYYFLWGGSLMFCLFRLRVELPFLDIWDICRVKAQDQHRALG